MLAVTHVMKALSRKKGNEESISASHHSLATFAKMKLVVDVGGRGVAGVPGHVIGW